MSFDITDINNVAQVATDLYNNKLQQFSADEGNSLIYKALVAANNGKTYFDIRDVRDGKCAKLFALIETIIKKNVVDGLNGNEWFMQLVETRIVNEGDKPEFRVEDANWYTVSRVSGGNQAVRRQRITGTERVTIPTSWHIVKIFEEMERIMSGETNMAECIRDVARSFQQNIWQDVAAAWQGLTQAQFGGATYDVTGSWDETKMINLIQHVEAKSGQNAAVYGTMLGLSKMASGVEATSAKEDMYNIGYYGKFRGTNTIKVAQQHKLGTDDFLFNDNVLSVLAGPVKPIKLVIEGNPLVNLSSYFDNQDLTQDYVYGQKYGVGYVMGNGAMGRYTIS